MAHKDVMVWREANPDEYRACCAAANARRTPAALRRGHLMRNYGLTEGMYAAMLAAQGGKCGVCGKLPSGKSRYGKLCVDHDHKAGRVRGLLCRSCNLGIGLLQDSMDVLRAASAYLDKYS
jgi:hypothetical protein